MVLCMIGIDYTSYYNGVITGSNKAIIKFVEEINKRENNNSIRACMYRTIRSMNGIKINFLLVTYRLSSNASFLTFATDRTRSVSFES